MKTITALIALTFLNCTFAQMKLEITPSDSKYAKMQIDCVNLVDCDDKLLKWIEKQKFFKGAWSSEQADSIVSKKQFDIATDAEIDVYFKPDNFSITLTDMSAEIADGKAKKEKDATDMQAIKAKILDGSAKLKDLILYMKIKEGL